MRPSADDVNLLGGNITAMEENLENLNVAIKRLVWKKTQRNQNIYC
jgi:hypothetical protein